MADEDYRHRTKGRFGIRTNKTLKYNIDEAWNRRRENLDTIVVIDKDDESYRRTDVRQLVGISLNARKNWELIENKDKNSLKSSQDDLEVDYGPRIVVLEDNRRRVQSSRKAEIMYEIHGASSDQEENEKESESNFISGTNRKGFFVKEKRKKGKKGVLWPERKGNRARSKSFNNKSDSSESDSDSAIDEPEKDNRLIIASVKPKNPDYVRHADLPGCGCPLCTGRVKNSKVAQRREIIRDINNL